MIVIMCETFVLFIYFISNCARNHINFKESTAVKVKLLATGFHFLRATLAYCETKEAINKSVLKDETEGK